MELGDGQSKWIDRLELWEGFRLVGHLFRIEVVRDREHPVLRARLSGIADGVELVDAHQRGPLRHHRALNLLGGHASDGDVAHVHVALLDLAGCNLRDGVRRRCPHP